MNKKSIRNYGLLDLPISAEEYIFGGETKLVAQPVLVPDGDWSPYRGTFLEQRDLNGGPDSLNCTGFSYCKALEALFNWHIKHKTISDNLIKWLRDNEYFDENDNINFSERFIGKLAKTDIYQGNSLHNVANAVRKGGLIPEKKYKYLPFYNSEPFVWRDYYATIPQELINLGQEFIKFFNIGYETVYSKWDEAIKYSALQSGVYAWPNPVNGIYKRTTLPINHAICIENTPPVTYDIYDSYEIGGDAIKHLAANYNFLTYSYRFQLDTLIEPLNFNNVKPMTITLKKEFIRDAKKGAFYFSKRGTNKIQEIKTIGGVLTLLDRTILPAQQVESTELDKFDKTTEFFGVDEIKVSDKEAKAYSKKYLSKKGGK